MTANKVQTRETQANNGVNVMALLGAREALKKAPQAAQFKWRASCEWLRGTHSRSQIGSFFGLGAEQARDKTFAVEADHPRVFASEDNAPTPVETGTLRTRQLPDGRRGRGRAAARHSAPLGQGLARGRHGLQGILGIDDDVRNGFGAIRVHFDIRADASRGRHQGARRPVAEAFCGVRHRHQPHQRLRHGELRST